MFGVRITLAADKGGAKKLKTKLWRGIEVVITRRS